MATEQSPKVGECPPQIALCDVSGTAAVGGKPTFERQQHHHEAKVDPARHADPAAGRPRAVINNDASPEQTVRRDPRIEEAATLVGEHAN
jgi:hypothetical protein